VEVIKGLEIAVKPGPVCLLTTAPKLVVNTSNEQALKSCE